MTFRATPGGSKKKRMLTTGLGAASPPVVGPELLVNGDFNAGQPPWAVSGSDGTHIATFDGATLRYQSDTTTPVLTVSQPNIHIVGKAYQVTVVVSAGVSGSIKSDNLGGIVLCSFTPGTYVSQGVCTASTAFSLLRNSANVDITIDSISVKQLF